MQGLRGDCQVTGDRTINEQKGAAYGHTRAFEDLPGSTKPWPHQLEGDQAHLLFVTLARLSCLHFLRVLASNSH